KWFAPGEALPPGYVITAHPEGHTTPQETDNVTEKARDWISAVKQRPFDFKNPGAPDVLSEAKTLIARLETMGWKGSVRTSGPDVPVSP
ncbi:unnamed protein product, partial [Symbiodinium pilosum]